MTSCSKLSSENYIKLQQQAYMTWSDRSSKKNIYGRNSRRILMGSIQRQNHHPCGKTWQWKHHAVGNPWLSKSARTHIACDHETTCFHFSMFQYFTLVYLIKYMDVCGCLGQNVKKFQWYLCFHKDRVAIILLCSLVNHHPNPYSRTFFSAAGTNSSGTECLPSTIR